ncbi:hypothetical protein ACS0TY_013030 [Phlomoides rotata]
MGRAEASERVRWEKFEIHLLRRITEVPATSLIEAVELLLSGPAELYQQMLAKALELIIGHKFEAKLLLLDLNDFSLKMQSKYGITKKDSFLKRSISEVTLQRMSSFLGNTGMKKHA